MCLIQPANSNEIIPSVSALSLSSFPCRVEIPFVFQMMQSGLVHGLAFWFDVAFVGSLYVPPVLEVTKRTNEAQILSHVFKSQSNWPKRFFTGF